MTSRAAAEGRGRLPLAAFCLLATLLLSPTVEASRGLPVALAPALTSPSTPDQVLEATLSGPPERLRLFDDLRLPERPLELVEARKTASGVKHYTLGLNIMQIGGLSRNRGGLSFQGLWTDPVTGLSYARNRWYDARTASWLSEDPMGAVDSPNLYAFVGWGPHMYTDPMGEEIPDWLRPFHSWLQGAAFEASRNANATLAARMKPLKDDIKEINWMTDKIVGTGAHAVGGTIGFGLDVTYGTVVAEDKLAHLTDRNFLSLTLKVPRPVSPEPPPHAPRTCSIGVF